MSKSKNVSAAPATTQDVRAWFSENPDLVPEGDKTVGPNSAGRGRISKPARDLFAERTGRTFVEGDAAAKVVTLSYKHVQPSGRKVTKSVNLKPAEIRALVPNAPERGRLSAAFMEAAGEAYAAKVSAESAKA